MSQMKDFKHNAKRPPLAGIPNHSETQSTIIQSSFSSQPYLSSKSRNPGRIVFSGSVINTSLSKRPNQKAQFKTEALVPDVLQTTLKNSTQIKNVENSQHIAQKPPPFPPNQDPNNQNQTGESIKPKTISTNQTQQVSAANTNTSQQAPAANISSEKQKTNVKNRSNLQHNAIAPSAADSDDIVKYDVMISYSHQDMDLMRFVLKSLKDRGFAVWVDQEGLKAGVDFLSKIGQAIVDSTCFLQILTPASVVSKYCRDELSLAYISNKSIHVICNADKDELFEKMDFGQKLTLAPYKSGFVDVSDLRLKKAKMDYICDQIKVKIQRVKDKEEQKDARFLHTREKQLKSNDLGPEKFWEMYFGDKETLTWDQFVQTFVQHFGSILQMTVPRQEQEWLLTVFEKELCDEDSHGQVSLSDLMRFCHSETTNTSCVWESVERYAREQIAIKGVFTIDSSVRLDAIENLSKFKSPAVQEALLDLLKDPDPNVRSVAALSVARVSLEGDELKIATRVARLLKDRDRLVRESACVALGRMKAQNKVPDLVNVWRNDVISVVRDAAYLALELIGGEEAAKAIYVTNVLSEEIKSITST